MSIGQTVKQPLSALNLDTPNMVYYTCYSLYANKMIYSLYMFMWSFITGALAVKQIYTNYELSTSVYGLHCDGNESLIFDCSYDTLPETGSKCQQGYNYDASVFCMGMM